MFATPIAIANQKGGVGKTTTNAALCCGHVHNAPLLDGRNTTGLALKMFQK